MPRPTLVRVGMVCVVMACILLALDRADARAPERQFGPVENGLALSIDGPSSARRGDTPIVTLRIRADPSLGEDVPTLDAHPSARARLRLTPEAGGATVVLNADRDVAARPSSDGVAAVRPRPDAEYGSVEFPLAHDWDRIAPGNWTAVVELVHEGPGTVPLAGTYRGTLVSQPLRFTVTEPPERWLDVIASPSFLRGKVDGVIRLPVRNGFKVGIQWNRGRKIAEPDGRPFDATILGIFRARGHPAFRIFETVDPLAATESRRWDDAMYRMLWDLR